MVKSKKSNKIMDAIVHDVFTLDKLVTEYAWTDSKGCTASIDRSNLPTVEVDLKTLYEYKFLELDKQRRDAGIAKIKMDLERSKIQYRDPIIESQIVSELFTQD